MSSESETEEDGYESADESGSKELNEERKELLQENLEHSSGSLSDPIKDNTVKIESPLRNEANILQNITVNVDGGAQELNSSSKNINEAKSESKDCQKSEDENKCQLNETVKLEMQKQPASNKVSGWGGWASSWSSTLLTTAVSSVSTLASSLGDGLQTVIDTAEEALGVPKPEEIAQAQDENWKEPTNQLIQDDIIVAEEPVSLPSNNTLTMETSCVTDLNEHPNQSSSSWGLSSLTNVWQQTSGFVQHKSKNIVDGSLQALETLGKKTFEVIAEGDYGLKQALHSSHGPTLSQILLDAKKTSESQVQEEENSESWRKNCLEAQLENFQGIVQLEALEILSKQCEVKLNEILGTVAKEKLRQLKLNLLTVKHHFDTDFSTDEEHEEHNFNQELTEYIGQLGVQCSADKIIQVKNGVADRIEKLRSDNDNSAEVVYEVALASIAEITACYIQLVHKVAQLYLMQERLAPQVYEEKAVYLTNITRLVCSEVNRNSIYFVQLITQVKELPNDDPSPAANVVITDIYQLAIKCTDYIRSSFCLLLPVMQVLTTESSINLS